MISRGLFTSIFLCLFMYSLPGCRSKQNTLDDTESKRVDSLISVQKINNRTLLVKFGYDAITAIETDENIVIVDAGISTELTAKYRKLIENVFHNDDFGYVINTHGHHDHIGGNTVFPEARVLGHYNCTSDISERWTNPSKSILGIRNIVADYEKKLQQSTPRTAEWYDNFTQKIRYMSAYNDVMNRIPVRLPDITFSDSMTLDLGDTVFEMFYFGISHSNSDIVIYVPGLEILFTGDLFSKYGRPGFSLSAMDQRKCFAAAMWMQRRISRIKNVITGHGQILSADDLGKFNDNILGRYSGQN